MTPVRRSSEENVGCPYDLDRAVVEQEAERSVGLQSAEAAADRFVPADVDRKLCAVEMGAMFPSPDKRAAFGRPPHVQEPAKAGSKERREGFRGNLSVESGGRSSG